MGGPFLFMGGPFLFMGGPFWIDGGPLWIDDVGVLGIWGNLVMTRCQTFHLLT